jgi:hypothetical protein
MFLHILYVIDVLLNVSYIIKCQWLEYLFIDILNTDEELCTLSLFTFSLQPNVVEAGKLQNWHMSDMTQILDMHLSLLPVKCKQDLENSIWDMTYYV